MGAGTAAVLLDRGRGEPEPRADHGRQFWASAGRLAGPQGVHAYCRPHPRHRTSGRRSDDPRNLPIDRVFPVSPVLPVFPVLKHPWCAGTSLKLSDVYALDWVDWVDWVDWEDRVDRGDQCWGGVGGGAANLLSRPGRLEWLCGCGSTGLAPRMREKGVSASTAGSQF